MPIAESMLAEFEGEAIITRKFLERVPADKLGWTPHERSMTMGQLAFHIAALPGGVIQLATTERASIPQFGAAPQPESLEQILDTLESSIVTVRSILGTLDDARMREIWSASKDGKELFAVPRVGFMRSVLLNHWYQHRGQLSVYLRLLDVSVPSSYGPSADELPDFLLKAQSA
ncbi:MAG TPA: DinB family protein [Bryobacteraceae bacterium]|nr:DinB family protein [Bryobacteraceae bacterium]